MGAHSHPRLWAQRPSFVTLMTRECPACKFYNTTSVHVIFASNVFLLTKRSTKGCAVVPASHDPSFTIALPQLYVGDVQDSGRWPPLQQQQLEPLKNPWPPPWDIQVLAAACDQVPDRQRSRASRASFSSCVTLLASSCRNGSCACLSGCHAAANSQ